MHAQQSREVCVRIIVKGRVQGVGFRQSARQCARDLGIDLTATNQHDGSVLLETTASADAVEKLVAWSRSGPPRARVDDVTVINCNRYIGQVA